MNNWSAPQRPIDYAEQALVTAILEKTYPPGSTLPGERDLAAQLGVTRPTLREVLRRLERDGWLTIRQGKATSVNNFWQEGGLNVLGTLVRYSQQFPTNFVLNLLEVRLAMAPTYVRAAVERTPEAVIAHLNNHPISSDSATTFATFDWALHRILTIASGNPIYTLILNGFADFYEQTAILYYNSLEARSVSQDFYAHLLTLTQQQDGPKAEHLVRAVMQQSIDLWQKMEER